MCVLPLDLAGLGNRNLVMCVFPLGRVGKQEPCYVCVFPLDLAGLGNRNLVMYVFSRLRKCAFT